MNILEKTPRHTLLASADVMCLLQIKRTRLGQLIRAGEIPIPIRIGKPPQGQLRWRREEIEVWIESKRIESAAPEKVVGG